LTRDLANNPGQSGTLNVTLGVAADGSVKEATVRGASDPTHISNDVRTCIQSAVKNLLFTPAEKSSTIKYTITLGADPAPPGPPQRVLMGFPAFTVTRLHARYSKESLGEDLIFREATPIVGGREDYGAGKKQDTEAKPGSYNNFQARYVIRHPWGGEIKCANPVRGVWGGPPSGVAQPKTVAAKKLATVSRDGVTLASFLGPGNAVAPVVDPASTSTSPLDASASGDASDASERPRSACGCAVVGAPQPVTGGLASFALGLLFLARRRRLKR
jgi:MYXO-CTERM domain-containing protein